MLSDSEPTVLSNEINEVMTALKNNDPKAKVLKPYLNAGRWISPAINPFANLTSVFFTAMKEADIGDEDINQSSEIDQKEELKIFEDIMRLVPSFRDVVMACSEHRRALLNLIRMLQDASHSARNDDVAKTNTCIVDYIIPDEHVLYDRDDFPLPGKTDYIERGWNHPQYAVLLYPMAAQDNLNGEELTQILYEIEHGEQTISESEWPAFLYPRDTHPDVEDDQEGLFRGYLLPRVFRQIFTSPSSAMKPDSAKKGRPSKASLHRLTAVTGRNIAYVCVVTRIALRGLGWTIDDGSFEYPVFYQNIVSLFEDDPEDEWVKATLAWWNQQVPGLPRSTAGNVKKSKKNITQINGRIMDPIARAAAQRAAKKATISQPIFQAPPVSQATTLRDASPIVGSESEGEALTDLDSNLPILPSRSSTTPDVHIIPPPKRMASTPPPMDAKKLKTRKSSSRRR